MCTGRPLTSDEAEWENVLNRPNMWLLLADYFRNPTRIPQYTAATCSEQVIATINEEERRSGFRAITFSRDSEIGTFEDLPKNQEMLVCLDRLGKFKPWHSCAPGHLLVGGCSAGAWQPCPQGNRLLDMYRIISDTRDAVPGLQIVRADLPNMQPAL